MERGLRDQRSFAEQVYEVVREIPPGRVLSYGGVAALLGKPRAARGVGQALRQLPPQLSDVPWWRVVNSGGRISLPAPAGAIQRGRLRAEGVRFDSSGAVSWDRFGWRP